MDIVDRLIEIRKKLGYSQAKFASQLGLSRNFINQVENRNKNVSERTVSDICREFDINETWLKTGEGNMFIELTKEEEIATFIGEVLRDEDDSFKKRLISGLAALDETGWEVLENFLNSIQKKKTKVNLFERKIKAIKKNIRLNSARIR